MKEIIEKAKEFAFPITPLFDFANEIGQILAEKSGANEDIVMLGTLLMDVKLKQAMSENRVQDHVKMSLEATKEFLKQFKLNEETKEKIYNCVEAHHGNVPYTCKEAEICANADCYKFLHPKGFFVLLSILGKREDDFSKVLDIAEEKLDEKWNIVSLDPVKSELAAYRHILKQFIEEARNPGKTEMVR